MKQNKCPASLSTKGLPISWCFPRRAKLFCKEAQNVNLEAYCALPAVDVVRIRCCLLLFISLQQAAAAPAVSGAQIGLQGGVKEETGQDAGVTNSVLQSDQEAIWE